MPARLVTVFAFLNTCDLRTFGGREPDDELAEWLGTCEPAEYELAFALRRTLRAMARANRTGELDPGVATEFDRVSAALPLRARSNGDGGLGAGAANGGIAGTLADVLASVVVASADGSWVRMKECAAPDCRWIFYDHAKPRNSRWCSTAGCGNRMKTRAYRSRTA
ncbi:CGNR zinc finger domain-containing protein [Actinoallomurus sp. NBC_01490]|uniref:CGNR zinc finger domain-containing protein n=1 Tax=Actinoallomurus sp. NBC_01490 TaxID=2903557 RepID=UPI002E34EE5D|nr:CGNR zinc finger domain-containing protein [Actinoallomurus sp. NBC_01490]